MTIVGDDSCLYHALARMDKSRNTEVRKVLSNRAPDLWREVMQHDSEGAELQEFLTETADFSIYGGAAQIAMFAAIRRICIHVHAKGMNTLTYGSGVEFHLLYCHIGQAEGRPNHYDVLEKLAPEQSVVEQVRYLTYRRMPAEIREGTIVLTINLSGSLGKCEKALKLHADILLIQEHWRGPDGINSWQSKTKHAG